MNGLTILALMYLLIVKHYIVDYVFQTASAKALKQTATDRGGIMHSIQHGLCSFLVFIMFFGFLNPIIYIVVFCEIFVHYVIDWIITTLLHQIDRTPSLAEQRSLVEGIDDVFHYLTYVIMILICSFYYVG